METARCVCSPSNRYQEHGENPNPCFVSQVFRFVSSKNESLFLQRKNPRKIAWTIVYRRMHKKGITEEIAKKRSRKTVKHQRGIVGASLDSIAARRNQKPEVRAAAQAQALAKSKEDKKKRQEERKLNKAKVSIHYAS